MLVCALDDVGHVEHLVAVIDLQEVRITIVKAVGIGKQPNAGTSHLQALSVGRMSAAMPKSAPALSRLRRDMLHPWALSVDRIAP